MVGLENSLRYYIDSCEIMVQFPKFLIIFIFLIKLNSQFDVFLGLHLRNKSENCQRLLFRWSYWRRTTGGSCHWIQNCQRNKWLQVKISFFLLSNLYLLSMFSDSQLLPLTPNLKPTHKTYLAKLNFVFGMRPRILGQSRLINIFLILT